ncbi:V-type proton ATPase subunit E-like [Corticium candelabrum]|uniref:V-type proton ATPase subunit E-like n=1 Tax=Corticium candelabrum TaxID=121492 RepID=UPI002E263E4F|nr:V-type proton ATPase subunit E-like [Corticium candelabrum]
MALNDQEVEKQIRHMMNFIQQEATEKAEEIDAKAEEEFSIEKGRLVQQEKMKIMTVYEKREKQIDLQKKIQRSNLLNQARLQVLKRRDDSVEQLLKEARSHLSRITQNKKQYQELVKQLIIQGLYQLLEENVTIRCRKEDVNVVESSLDAAAQVYYDGTKKEVKMKVDKENYLGNDVSGGVELVAQGGRIKVVNTLDSRLELISRQMIPEVRMRLFGVNPSRKFDF